MSESQRLEENASGSIVKDEREKTQGEVDNVDNNGDAINDPRCWPRALRLRTTACIGILAFLEPFASSMVAPSLETIAEEFGVTSSVKRNVSHKSLATRIRRERF